MNKFQKIVLKHYTNPKFRGLTNKANTLVYKYKSSYCVDEITLELKIKNNKIVNPCFDGKGCTIAISSSDIVCEQLANKDINYASDYLENYLNMINGKNYDSKILEKALIYQNIYKHHSRSRCAEIIAKSFQKIITKQN